MPIDLVLVRHGESEGNLAQTHSKNGDDSLWTPEFKQKHNCQYRLTDRGRNQARAAGKWIKEHMGTFDAYFTSEYIRAMETAALLDIPKARWLADFFLRECDQGVLAGLSKQERKKRYASELKRREQDSFFVSPLGGESIANSCLRTHRVLSHLQRVCNGQKVLIVCHGNIIWTFRICIEKMKQKRFKKKLEDPREKVHNCQIIHYSRRDPYTGVIYPNLTYYRSVCPWDLSLSGQGKWVKIKTPIWTNNHLLKVVYSVPQILNTPEEDAEDAFLTDTTGTIYDEDDFDDDETSSSSSQQS